MDSIVYFSISVRMAGEFDSMIACAQHLNKYSQIESEDELVKHCDKELVDKKWPEAADINFYHLSMKYRDFLDPVINRLTCNIKPGMTVAVVGRAGAGKSSFINVLLRLTDHCEGSL